MCGRRHGRNLQGCVHGRESLFCLVEEPKDNTLRELAFVLVIVHLKDLLESGNINAVAEALKTDRPSFRLMALLAHAPLSTTHDQHQKRSPGPAYRVFRGLATARHLVFFR